MFNVEFSSFLNVSILKRKEDKKEKERNERLT